MFLTCIVRDGILTITSVKAQQARHMSLSLTPFFFFFNRFRTAVLIRQQGLTSIRGVRTIASGEKRAAPLIPVRATHSCFRHPGTRQYIHVRACFSIFIVRLSFIIFTHSVQVPQVVPWKV